MALPQTYLLMTASQGPAIQLHFLLILYLRLIRYTVGGKQACGSGWSMGCGAYFKSESLMHISRRSRQIKDPQYPTLAVFYDGRHEVGRKTVREAPFLFFFQVQPSYVPGPQIDLIKTVLVFFINLLHLKICAVQVYMGIEYETRQDVEGRTFFDIFY